MRIIGIKLRNGESSVIKNLHEDTWYPFGNYVEPSEQNRWKWNENEQDKGEKFLNQMYRSCLEDDTFAASMLITVNCIVGGNGSGKSTLLELMLRIINNFSYRLLDVAWKEGMEENNPQKGHELHEAGGFAARLYFEADNYLGIIDYAYGNTRIRYYSYEKEAMVMEDTLERASIGTRKLKDLLRHYFYTIVTNYSIYSFNEKDYDTKCLWNPDGIDGVDGSWIGGLLHKNDAYTSPVVLVPYRENNGSIDIENEQYLVKQRLSTLALLFASQGKSFMEDYELTRLAYRFNPNSSRHYRDKFNKWAKKLPKNDKDRMFQSFEKAWSSYIITLPNYPAMIQDVKTAILNYLCYKTLKICLLYREFGVLLGVREPIKGELEANDMEASPCYIADFRENCFEEIVKKITEEENSSHITLKIRQLLEFVRRNIYQTHARVENDGGLAGLTFKPVAEILSQNLQYLNKDKQEKKIVKRFTTYDDAFLSLPPAIFEWDVEFREKSTRKDGILLSNLSSGQKQLMQSFSYVLYHIKNLESVKDDKYTVGYHHINLVFDEAELYFHPEYQRQFICKLIRMLSWCHINGNKIRSLNMIVVTHSPFVLSDVPSCHVLYLANGYPERNDNETFAANIHELLHNQFFIKDYVGDVGRKAISDLVEDYNKVVNKEDADIQAKDLLNYPLEYYRYIANHVAEQYMRKNLLEMVDDMSQRIHPQDRLFQLERQEKLLREQLSDIERQKEQLRRR